MLMQWCVYYLINEMTSSQPPKHDVIYRSSWIGNQEQPSGHSSGDKDSQPARNHNSWDCGQGKPCQGKSSFNLQPISPYPDPGSLFATYVISPTSLIRGQYGKPPSIPKVARSCRYPNTVILAPEARKQPRPPQIPTA